MDALPSRFLLAGAVHLVITVTIANVAPQYVGWYVAIALLGTLLAYRVPVADQLAKLQSMLRG